MEKRRLNLRPFFIWYLLSIAFGFVCYALFGLAVGFICFLVLYVNGVLYYMMEAQHKIQIEYIIKGGK